MEMAPPTELVEIRFQVDPAVPVNPKHKRIYVSVNATAFILNQVERRFVALESALLAYDFDCRRDPKENVAHDRGVSFDMGYAKRNDIVSTAWDIVDWLDRLRRVLGVIAGVKKEAWYKLLMKSLAEVEDVRHHLQHFDKRLEELVGGSYPLMGALIASFPATPGRYTKFLLSTPVRYVADTAIRIHWFRHPDVVRGEVDRVTFSVASVAINLTDIMVRVRKGKAQLAAYLHKRYNFTWPD